MKQQVVEQHRRGISMVETVLSTVLVGFVLVGTLQIVGPIAQSTTVHADRLVAANLANELSEEIGMMFYTDPDIDDVDAIGIDASERAKVRADFDDVDDFHGWTASPPQLSTGAALSNLVGWERYVEVNHVLLVDAATDSKTNTGLKRITVTVTHHGTTLARVITLHSQAADSLGFVVTKQGE